jgi:hypothetical protein
MIAIILVFYIINVGLLGTFWPVIIYLPLLFLMVWGGISCRTEFGGFQNFKEAFLAVFIISVTATFLFDTFGYLLYKVIDPDIPGVIKEKVLENTTAMMERFGTSDDQLEKALDKIKDQDYTPTLQSQAIRYVSSFVIGAVLSALIALFVNRPDKSQPTLNAES